MNFALFRPGAKRQVVKLKTERLQLLSDGTFSRVAAPGVPNKDEWLVAWNLYRTVLIMLEAVTLGTLESYEEKFLRFTLLFSKEWPVLVRRRSSCARATSPSLRASTRA